MFLCRTVWEKAVTGVGRRHAVYTLFFFSAFMCFLLIRKPLNEKGNLAIWSKLMSS